MLFLVFLFALIGGGLVGFAVGWRWRDNAGAEDWLDGFRAHAETLTYGQPDPSDSATGI